MTDFQIYQQHEKFTAKFNQIIKHCESLSANELLTFIQKVKTSVKPEYKAIYAAAIHSFQQSQVIATKGMIK